MAEAVKEPSWWEQTLDYVIRSAADSRSRERTIKASGQYQVDAYGNLVQMGQPTGQMMVNPGAAAQSPLVMVALVAVAGLLVWKLVK